MNIKMETFLVKIVRFVQSKLNSLLQWEPEIYGTERQHHSVFDVIVTSQTKLISNWLNHLSFYMGLSLNCRLPMPEFSCYHEYYKTKY